MNRAVLKKCLIEVRLLWAACALLLFAFCWMRVFIVSTLETVDFAGIVERLWDKWSKFSPVPLSHLVSYPGRIAIGYDEPIVVFTVSIFAIARGSDVVSGELNRGTLELLLAQPVSRLQVLYTQALVTVAGLALLAAATWSGTWTGIQTTTVKESAPPPKISFAPLGIEIPLPFAGGEKIEAPMRDKVNPRDFLPGAFNLFCLGVAIAGAASLVSSCDRYRWRTIGIVVGLYIVSLIFKIVGLAFESLHWARALSLFTAYEPQRFIAIAVRQPEQAWSLTLTDSAGKFVELGPLGYNLILLGIGFVAYLAAGAVFHKRDLPAPL
ncbi:MAG: ABC transporter permease subunit [Pirellulaceae bacterium]|nr:ABC transporter permease subunit [Pirellulaceae bacterium]